MEIGSQEWLDRCCDRINASSSYREAARGWTCPLGLTFLDDAGTPAHHVVLRLRDGRCEAADEVDETQVQDVPVRLTAKYRVWSRVLTDEVNLLKAIMLRQIRLDGDLLQIVKYATAARALIECIGQVEAEVPAAPAT